jgi:cell fate (sporulation/competence/biofilm development) regulator YmcA (YheA/YmcA/DUF963 family)
MYHKQMTDGELLDLLNAIKSTTRVQDFTPAQNQILAECLIRKIVNPEEAN